MMNRIFGSTLLGIVVTVTLMSVGCDAENADDEAEVTSASDESLAVRVCRGDFSAGVRVGPNIGLEMHGELDYFLFTNGLLLGELKPASDGAAPVPFTGSAYGGLVGLVFELGKNPDNPGQEWVIFGNGVAQGTLSHCGSAMGGSFAGPVEGDIGDWLLFDSVDVTQTFTVTITTEDFTSAAKVSGPCMFKGGICKCSQTVQQCKSAGGTSAFCETCCSGPCFYDPLPEADPELVTLDY